MSLAVAQVPGEDVSVNAQHLIGTAGAVEGWGSGDARDSQNTLEFSSLRGITPRIETYSLDEVTAAYDRMMANDARFRVVLEP